MRTLTLTLQAPDRASIANALITLAGTITDDITKVGGSGSVAQQTDVHWQWHLAQPHIDYSNTQALLDHNLIDQDEKAVLDRVNPDTIAQACRTGHYALKQLILLHAALQGKLRPTGPTA